MKSKLWHCLALVSWSLSPAWGADPILPNKPALESKSYVLSPSDLLQIKVYQEPDLETKLRLGKDGSATFPLLGTVNLGGKTLEEATTYIRDRLEKDYLVNPQVTVTVVEYSKRRFTVLGQVQKPGYYEIPNEESVTLLQAIAMAGGYSRLADPSQITVKRKVACREVSFKLNARAMARDNGALSFEILPDDIITASERLF